MNKWLNDPKINRKYNYTYKLTNTINGKIYIGVHRTDVIDDGYMGSGVILKRAKDKYGVDAFEKEILNFFNTYQEALDEERRIVTKEFINEDTNYNVKEGGYGNCEWAKSMISQLSESARKRWESDEYREMMQEKVYSNEERNKKIGQGRSEWIKNNPEEHSKNMDKINKNPDKIAKTAEKHRGMKRSEETKKNVSDALKEMYKNDPNKKDSIVGKGCMYIHNVETKKIKRISKDDIIPNGWVKGTGVKRKTTHKSINKGSFFAHDAKTLEIKRFKKDQVIPEGWIKGRPKKS